MATGWDDPDLTCAGDACVCGCGDETCARLRPVIDNTRNIQFSENRKPFRVSSTAVTSNTWSAALCLEHNIGWLEALHRRVSGAPGYGSDQCLMPFPGKMVNGGAHVRKQQIQFDFSVGKGGRVAAAPLTSDDTLVCVANANNILNQFGGARANAARITPLEIRVVSYTLDAFPVQSSLSLTTTCDNREWFDGSVYVGSGVPKDGSDLHGFPLLPKYSGTVPENWSVAFRAPPSTYSSIDYALFGLHSVEDIISVVRNLSVSKLSGTMVDLRMPRPEATAFDPVDDMDHRQVMLNVASWFALESLEAIHRATAASLRTDDPYESMIVVDGANQATYIRVSVDAFNSVLRALHGVNERESFVVRRNAEDPGVNYAGHTKPHSTIQLVVRPVDLAGLAIYKREVHAAVCKAVSVTLEITAVAVPLYES